jgi:hypothetical protein
LQPTYAPELNIVGVAQGGTPANLTATAEFIVSIRVTGLSSLEYLLMARIAGRRSFSRM